MFFNIDAISLKIGFVKKAFLISLLSFQLGSTDDFLLVWCLLIVGSCKARRQMYHFCSLMC